jgi:hypothetical protein
VFLQERYRGSVHLVCIVVCQGRSKRLHAEKIL